jgi:hypothetical protein
MAMTEFTYNYTKTLIQICCDVCSNLDIKYNLHYWDDVNRSNERSDFRLNDHINFDFKIFKTIRYNARTYKSMKYSFCFFVNSDSLTFSICASHWPSFTLKELCLLDVSDKNKFKVTLTEYILKLKEGLWPCTECGTWHPTNHLRDQHMYAYDDEYYEHSYYNRGHLVCKDCFKNNYKKIVIVYYETKDKEPVHSTFNDFRYCSLKDTKKKEK